MGTRILVDGHNLLRAGALPLSSDPLGPEGREEICALLSSYARARSFRLTVVFDSPAGQPGGRASVPFKGGTAIYAAPRETADDVLRDLARGAGRGTVVVTDDRGLADSLPSREVTVVPCRAFAARLEAAALESVKGGAEDAVPHRRGTEKKGEGRRLKKGERRREDLLKKL